MNIKKSTFTKVRKRDGRIVDWDQSRITSAIYKALEATQEGDLARDPIKICDRAVKTLEKKFPSTYVPHIEEIQDAVEEALILLDFPKTAKAYILYRNDRAQIRENRKLVPEHIKKLTSDSKKYFRNALAEFIYYRTDSRWIDGEERRETWIETVDRWMSFMRENIGSKLNEDEYNQIREAILWRNVAPSMRLIWSAGRAAGKTNVAAYNCSYIAPSKLEDFAEIMYLSMCGTGVGFSVESQTVQQLPFIKKQTGETPAIFVIEDSKEGWGDALTAGMKAWYDGKDIKFDYSKLRPAGARLQTMGGRSSGPEPLRALLDFARVKILSRQGKRLSNINVHDIVCKIGEVVVMGGVRRTALISLSDLDDEEMRHSKEGQFYLTEPQRQMANNSAVYNQKPTAAEFMEEWLALAKSGTGERGIFNRGELKSQLPERRWKIFEKDAATAGTNPCVTDDTWVMTASGSKQVKDLINEPFKAVVDGHLYDASGFFNTGIKEVFEVKTRSGFSFRATSNHLVSVIKYRSRKKQINQWKEVKDLKIGDEAVLHNHQRFIWGGLGTESEGWLLGNLLGDGNIEKNGKANLDYWGENKIYMMQKAADLVHQSVGARSDSVGYLAKTGYARVQSVNLGKLANSFNIRYGNKVISDEIEKTSAEFYNGFLRGLFDADGSVQGDQKKGVSVRLNFSHLDNLLRVQRMLARLGIISKIYENRHDEGLKLMPDGKGGQKEYHVKANHDLIISGSNLYYFKELINFNDPDKKMKLQLLFQNYQRNLNKENFSAEIIEIKPIGQRPVYDCVVPDINAFDGNGVYLHNCGEIVLKSKQFCNLTEVICRPEDTEETLLEKIRIAAIIGTYQATLTNFPYLSKEWKKNCEEERLLGVSLSGQWDCPAVRNAETLVRLKEKAIEVNREYAKRFGINQSSAITCVKPSGTVAERADCSPGMHARHAPFYIRRVRISATDPLFQMLKDQKFPYYPEVGQAEGSASTYVLEFPVKAPVGSVFKKDLDVIGQLEYWKMIKKNYTEHNPSVTISVDNDEWIKTANWLYENWDMLGGLSFLPRADHVYMLAPYEEITEEKYNELITKMPEIDFSEIIVYEKEDLTQGARELACVAGVCEVDFANQQPVADVTAVAPAVI